MGALRHSTFSPPPMDDAATIAPSAPSHSKCADPVTLKRLASTDKPTATRTISGKWLHLHTMLSFSVALVFTLSHSALASPVFVDNPSLAQFQSGRNIRHLPCIVRKSGRSGVCMFAIDCIKQNGTHLGTCIDRFYFGSCCQMKEEALLFAQEINDNSIDQNTISHFAHESTTLPTSALFKLTTENADHPSHPISSDGITETLRNATQSYLSNKIGSPATTTTSGSNVASTSSISTTTTGTTVAAVQGDRESPVQIAASKRPPTHTTHKTSQFVVRTTAKPKPTVPPTTVKPPKRRTTLKTTTTTTTTTTTPKPVLTTDAPAKVQLSDERIESTTLPTKFFTFQMVETTTGTVTEPTKAADLTPTPLPHQPNRRPSAKPKPKPTTGTSTTVTHQTAATPSNTRPGIEQTTRPRPLVTRRPEATKKPTLTKRPSMKPTRRPIISNATVEKIDLSILKNGSSTTHVPQLTVTSSQVHQGPTTLPTQTTRAPRPKPKPTAEIVKVPKPVTSSPPFTTIGSKVPSRPTSQAPSSVVTTRKPKPTATSTSSTSTSTSTTTASRPSPITTTTTNKPTSITTPATAAISTSTSTTARPSTLTTVAPKEESTLGVMKPGLITWTDVDAEPAMNVSGGGLDWQPRPPISADWIPVSTVAPLADNKTVSGSGDRTTENAVASTTDRTVISVSTSISEVLGNASAMTPRPQRPTLATTKVPKPKPKPKPTMTTTTNTPSNQFASSTTQATSPSTATVESEASTDTSVSMSESEATTESISVESSTDDFNASAEMTTVAPTNSLEGMDYKQICGRRMFPEPRIVGGSNAAFGRWPWQISLRQWRTSTYLHKCGAALLNENWAITAAHCVDNVPPSDLLLRLGEYDLAEEEEPYGYQERRVQIVASHPQFDPRTFEYDLALLRFYEPVVFQPNIIPVCVPDSDLDFIGQTAFVTGWGRLYEDGPLPSVLQEVAVPVINNTICESMYRAAGYIELIPHIFICAGWKKGGYDSCEGDSGGPMVLQREEDKRFQLGGVISWGIGCAEANQPGVYTRISEFRDWINQILQF